MKPELIEWLARDHPVHLSVLFATDALRRECGRAVVGTATEAVFVFSLASVEAVPTLWTRSKTFELLIRGLVEKVDLLVGEELQQVLDRGLYSSTLNVLFSDLWEARFTHVEGSGSDSDIARLLGKSFPLEDQARLVTLPLSWVNHDILLFWLSLAKTNGLLERVVVWLPVDAGDDAHHLHHLHQLLLSTERWAQLGAPLRFVIGLIEGSRVLEHLQAHPLSAKLQESVV